MKILSRKTAVVTGAAMGLGRALCLDLVKEGCRVALVDVNADALEKTRKEFPDGVHAFTCDVSNRQDVALLADRVREAMGPVSILVNNAGIMRAAPLLELEDSAIERMIGVNLTAHFWTVKAFLPQMLECGEGAVVNVASAGGLLALPSLSAYCASKFGVVGFSDALRQEAKRYRWPVTVTCVCPNTVNTGMFDGARMVAGTHMLDADTVSRRIVRGIKKGLPYVAIPSVAVGFLTPLTKVMLPAAAMDQVNRLLGMWSANDSTVGRAGKHS